MTGALRSVLAVLLATALLGAAAPAADRAREERTAARLAAETGDLATATRTLATRGGDRSAPAGTEHASRRFVTVRIPDGGTLAVRDPATGNGSARRPALAWRLDGGPWHDRPPDGGRSVSEAFDIRPVGDDFRLGSGHHRLRLSLVADGSRPVVRVARAEGPGD